MQDEMTWLRGVLKQYEMRIQGCRQIARDAPAQAADWLKQAEMLESHKQHFAARLEHLAATEAAFEEIGDSLNHVHDPENPKQ